MPHIIRKANESKPRDITCGEMRDLTTSKDFNGMDIVHVTITDPTKEHYHKELTEVYYVLKGSIDVEADDIVEHLEKGGLIMIFPRTNHKAWKTSQEDAEILVICCPPWTEEDEVMI
ncbi:MAG: cupin domain-containing protein [Candidatus Diapherotrites archaeon]|nr:cupin domain-containing protein [Candidatus Diapherotrites archaeon]